MPRQTLDFTVIKPKNAKYYKGKISGWHNYRSTGAATRRDALRVVRRWFDESRTSSDITFGEYANYFFGPDCPHCKRLAEDGAPVSGQWKRTRKGHFQKHIKDDEICKNRLHELTRDDFLEFRGRILAKDLAVATRNQIVGFVKTVIKEALFRELINRDITAGVKNLKGSTATRYLPTLEEVHQLLAPGDHWRDEVPRLAFILAATLGMRRGELFALKWEHITENVVSIIEAYKEAESKELQPTYGAPKWSIYRQIPLPSSVAAMLKEWPRLGPFVLSRPAPPSPGWWMHNWHEALRKSDLEKEHFTPHSLRHFANTHLLREGFPPQYVRAYLGWSDENENQQDKLTRVQRGYLHIPPGDLISLAESMSKMICTDRKGKQTGITCVIYNRI